MKLFKLILIPIGKETTKSTGNNCIKQFIASIIMVGNGEKIA